MIIIIFLGGMISGAAALLFLRPRRIMRHTDYRERWEEAVKLLGSQEQLTAEQVSRLLNGDVTTPGHARDPVPAVTQKELHSMPSWDRKSIEIARAKAGLPPADNLTGMASWDKRDVLTTRARYGLERDGK